MKLMQALKIIWRSILSVQEAKETFFHDIEPLVNNKKYDLLFRKAHGQGVELVYYNSVEDLLYLRTKEGVVVETDRMYATFLEIFIHQEYALPPQVKDDFCVFDVGMNRGYTCLFFANYAQCKEVFGFELDPSTFESASRNFALNPALAGKITPFNFGLWEEEKEIEIRLRDSDACTTIDSLVPEYPRLNHLFKNKESQRKKVRVKRASIEISALLKTLPAGRKKILKIDIEGSEYAVFKDLYDQGVLNEFDLIMGECHNGLEGLEEYLTDFTCIHKSKDKGLFLNFAFLKHVQ